jgi:hypothetical protein
MPSLAKSTELSRLHRNSLVLDDSQNFVLGRGKRQLD